MEGNSSTKAKQKGLEGSGLLEQQFSWLQRLGHECNYLLGFSMDKLVVLVCFYFYCDFLSLCWKVVLPSQLQSLEIAFSLVIFENFAQQPLSKSYFLCIHVRELTKALKDFTPTHTCKISQLLKRRCHVPPLF